MKAGQELTEIHNYKEIKKERKNSHMTRSFHKYQPAHFSRRIRGTGGFMRSLTAAVIMVMAVLAPIHILPSYASPSPNKALAAVMVDNETVDTRQLSKGGDRLTKKERSRLLAETLLLKAEAVEPEVTADMRTLEKSSAHLQGLEYRLKTMDSLMRKIESDAEEDQVSLMAAAAGISDVLRYTLTCSAEDYGQTVPEAISVLMAKGYRVEKFRNAWGEKFYQGVNVHLLSPAGTRVELQFHTLQSFAIKQASHKVYEIRRNPASTAEEIAEATRLSLAYNAKVIEPEGARAISWPLAA